MNLRARRVIAEKMIGVLSDPLLREHSLESRDLAALLGQWSSGAVSGFMPDPVPVDMEQTPGIVAMNHEHSTQS